MTLPGLYYLLEGFAIAFFGIMAVQNLWHRDERLRTILGYILLFWMAQHLVSVIFTSDLINGTRNWSQLINAVDMTAEPTCCFLLIELCRPGWLNWRKVAVNMTPFVALIAAFFATGNRLWYTVLIWFFVAYGVGVFIATLYYIPKYNRFLKEHFSYDENVNLRWLYYVLNTFFALMFVYAICASFNTVAGDCIYMFGSITCWTMICYFIHRQESVLFELKATENESLTSPQTNDGATAVSAMPPIDFERAIKECFIDTQLYLKPQLKLGDMAEAIGTNRTYLSRYLNTSMQTTFYDYVNALRLDHATQMIENSDYSIQAIASIAGFNSYSTFRRSFIARYGQTPQDYRNSHR